MDNHESRVARGARLLDERRPRWFIRVDPDTLDLNDCVQCVIGQLAGRYSHLNDIFPEWPEPFVNDDCAIAHGLIEPGANDEFSIPQYPRLTDAWREEIRLRREALPVKE